MPLLYNKLKLPVRYFICLIALTFFCKPAVAQLITGEVFKQGTNIPVPAAVVYFKGFSDAVATDEHGRFEIPAKPAYTQLVISCTGYQTLVLNTDTALHKFYLTPSIQHLKDVIVIADGLSRDQKLKAFRKEFLGTSKFAKNCRIVNPDDISITYYKKQQTLKAFAYSPLLIENKDLGYLITYELDSLISSPEKLLVVGNYTFTELPEVSAENKKNREEAYRGSKMHFIRALVSNKLKPEGFTTTNRLTFLITEPDLVLDSAGLHYFKFPGKVFINYRNRQSIMYSTLPLAIAGNDGYFNTALVWVGHMSQKRVADMLPFNYVVTTTGIPKPDTLSQMAKLKDNKPLNTVEINTTRPNIGALKPDTLNKTTGLKDTIQLKAVEVRTNRTLILRDGWPYQTWGKSQTLNITLADSTYKTLEWYVLKNLKGARSSTNTDVTGVVFSGLSPVTKQIATLYGEASIEQMANTEAIPLLFINGKELNMTEPAQAELYRRQYFSMPVTSFSKIVFQRYTGIKGEKFILFLTLK